MKRRFRLTDGHSKFLMTVSESSGGNRYVDDEVIDWS